MKLSSRKKVSVPIVLWQEMKTSLSMDASETGIGGILYQIIDGKTAIIMFMSYQLTAAQSRWHTTEREGIAVNKCIEEAHWPLHGSKFPITVYTDHTALVTVLKADDPHGRLCRGDYFCLT